jgi:hypothetical protein
MNTVTMNDSLTKLVYVSILAGLILAFTKPIRLSHPHSDAAGANSAVAASAPAR